MNEATTKASTPPILQRQAQSTKYKAMTYSISPELLQESGDSDGEFLEATTKKNEPAWIEEKRGEWGDRVVVPEWEDRDDYRAKNGWKGRDLMHDASSAVFISEYFVEYGDKHVLPGFTRGGVGTVLTGIVNFTPMAESHQGFCHGGSMTSVLDDVIGWAAFMVTGECKPWSGFTVQVQTSLKKPIMVNSTLLIRGTITNTERRKVTINAELIDPLDDSIHATGEGLTVLNRGILPLLTQESTESMSRS